VDKLPIEKMNGDDIARALFEQPQLIDKLPIEKMDSRNISYVLRWQPRLKGILEKKGRP
jgi:hypothetical protein